VARPKNGHTTHLLMSFPSHVRPEKAKLIAEAWAFEMFQSGEHQDDVWSYVAALHTDKAHPHVHMVVNNRGTVNDSWFFMAKSMSSIWSHEGAHGGDRSREGVFLDATSRAERGLLTYGPSRAEIERARLRAGHRKNGRVRVRRWRMPWRRWRARRMPCAA
jgi:type IV secretion system T-DNA border endonuclease VirD2